MSEGMYSAVVLGTVVEQSIAEQFKKVVAPNSSEEVIKAFIYSVVDGHLKVVTEEGE